MRSEEEMFDLSLGVARANERIRAVFMNGSRANPNAPKDKYRDYDIVYVVTETVPFIEDKSWLGAFGKRAMTQEPFWNDAQTGAGGEQEYDFSRCYAWLMLFEDGNRIDLTIEVMEETLKHFTDDKLTVTLLDKDGLLPAIPPPSDKDYHVKPPTAGKYAACCNEFWWCLNNVAKGSARDEIPYALGMFNASVRNMLEQMIEWYIGILTDFSVSAGKTGKYFKKHLPPALYEQYLSTYSGGSRGEIWELVFAACALFRGLAENVASRFGYAYSRTDDENMMKYLHRVRNAEL